MTPPHKEKKNTHTDIYFSRGGGGACAYSCLFRGSLCAPQINTT